MSDPLHGRLEACLRASPTVMQILAILRDLDFPQWRLVSGAVYQTVWNEITGRPADHGIKDYDIAYFDPDPSWDAEDTFIRRAAAALPETPAGRVEVRNQARVHLWFEGKFGLPYPQLPTADASLANYLSPAFAVGVRLERNGRLDIAAPFGLEACFAMRIAPNPGRRDAGRLARVVEKLRARWPELTIAPE